LVSLVSIATYLSLLSVANGLERDRSFG